MIAQDIADHGLERVVVAACSPRMHEPTFRRAAETAGLNPYLVEMANIREQCSWVHDDAVAATEKAEDLVRAAVLRVARHEPLERLTVDMCPNTLVIGGGIAGTTVALELADAGQLRSTSSSASQASVATSAASISRLPTWTRRATCSPTGSPGSSNTRTST